MSNKPLIYLASKSPRRRELLSQVGVGYRCLTVDIDETPRPDEAPERYVVRMALEKAQAGALQLDDCDEKIPVMGADTSVVIDGCILGKPRHREDGVAMLQRLSGRQHQVMTAVALMGSDGRLESRLSVSHVRFSRLSEAQCLAYWETGEPVDKAGGYGIQGYAAVFIEHLEGSFSGVMGLPLFETAALLRDFRICLPEAWVEGN